MDCLDLMDLDYADSNMYLRSGEPDYSRRTNVPQRLDVVKKACESRKLKGSCMV